MVYVIGNHECPRCGARYMSAWSVVDEGLVFECTMCEEVIAEAVGPAFSASLMPDVEANLAIADMVNKLRFGAIPPRRRES